MYARQPRPSDIDKDRKNSAILFIKAQTTSPKNEFLCWLFSFSSVPTLPLTSLRSARSRLDFISRLFVSCFWVDFSSEVADNSGLFSKSTKRNPPKRATKRPKCFLSSNSWLMNKIQIGFEGRRRLGKAKTSFSPQKAQTISPKNEFLCWLFALFVK